MATSLPTTHTAALVLGELPRPNCRIADVGCGDGAVSEVVQRAGHTVVGIESNPTAAARALERGVDCRNVAWLDFHDDAAFDAIVFSRSLHHLSPLDTVVDHAASQLAGDGRLVVEDFAFADASRETIEWFTRLLRQAFDDEWIDTASLTDTFAADLLRDGPAAWHRSHGHDLHSASAMQAALEQSFLLTAKEPVPYLYRYAAAVFPPTVDGDKHARSVFDRELAAAHLGQIDLIGRRFVGRVRRAEQS